MKLLKLAAVLLPAAILLPVGGCSSGTDDKQPKAVGPIDPKLKPASREVGGEGPVPKQGSGAQSKGAIGKD